MGPNRFILELIIFFLNLYKIFSSSIAFVNFYLITTIYKVYSIFISFKNTNFSSIFSTNDSVDHTNNYLHDKKLTQNIPILMINLKI